MISVCVLFSSLILLINANPNVPPKDVPIRIEYIREPCRQDCDADREEYHWQHIHECYRRVKPDSSVFLTPSFVMCLPPGNNLWFCFLHKLVYNHNGLRPLIFRTNHRLAVTLLLSLEIGLFKTIHGPFFFLPNNPISASPVRISRSLPMSYLSFTHIRSPRAPLRSCRTTVVRA